MTPERLREIRGVLGGIAVGVPQSMAADLLAEIDHLRDALDRMTVRHERMVSAGGTLVAEVDRLRAAHERLREAVREVLDEPHAYIGGRERAVLTAALGDG